MRKLIGVLIVGLLAVGVVIGQDKRAERGTAKRIAGRCHCGHIKYEARGPIVKCSYCDCRGCQRATGTLKAPFVTVHRTQFKVIAGEPSLFKATSRVKCDAHGVWHFCPKCGTQVFWKGDKRNDLDIFAGTLDDATVFQEALAKGVREARQHYTQAIEHIERALGAEGVDL